MTGYSERTLPEYAIDRRRHFIVRVHQHGTGCKGGLKSQAIGRSRGGLTTKIVALVGASRQPDDRFLLLPGQRHDSIGVAPLIEGIDFEALLADKAFDIDWIRAELDSRGAMAVIPPKADRVRSMAMACDGSRCTNGAISSRISSAISSSSGASPRDTIKTDTS